MATAPGIPAFTTTREDWRLTQQEGRFLKVITASLAKQTLRKDQAANKFPRDKKDYIIVTDRALGRPEERVKFGGRIVYQNNSEGVSNISTVLEWIARYILLLSPVGRKRPQDRARYRKIHYEDAHLYMINGRSHMTVDSQTSTIEFGRVWQSAGVRGIAKHQFVNTMPYAKRIESKRVTTRKQGAWNSISPWSYQAPSGVYKKVARAAKRRFGETVRITYGVVQMNLPHTMGDLAGGRMKQLYPVITVRPNTATRQT